ALLRPVRCFTENASKRRYACQRKRMRSAPFCPLTSIPGDDVLGEFEAQRRLSHLEPNMQYVCDASATKTWFRIETDAEDALESRALNHAVESYFRQAQARAAGN